MRRLYDIRERSSNMYSWTAMTASQIAIEIPWNILGSSCFFACLYWTVGFGSDRAAYTYLLLGITYSIYYTTFSLAVAAMSPDAQIAGPLLSLFFFFVLGL
jgi:ATP-binding cassette subfamily G (WHITE) protein 2 (SNQ2)